MRQRGHDLQRVIADWISAAEIPERRMIREVELKVARQLRAAEDRQTQCEREDETPQGVHFP